MIKYVFAHWGEEINIKRYGDALQIVPSKLLGIYRYSDAMPKHISKYVLKT